MKTTVSIQAAIRSLAVSTALTMTFLPGLVSAQGFLAPPPVGTLPFGDEALDGSGAPKANMKSLTQTDPGQPIPSKNAALPDLDGSMPAYTITVPGNYFLTENLIGDKPILVLSDDVTIDLRGHEIRYMPAGGATGTAIMAGPTPGGMALRTHVRNGFVVGEWDAGVVLGEYSSVRDLNVAGAKSFAIAVGGQSTVHNCIVHGMALEGSDGSLGHAGILGGPGTVVSHSTAREIHGDGIRVEHASRVVDCVVTCVLGSGVVTGHTSSIEGTTSHMNNEKGFRCAEGTSIVNSTSSENLQDGFHVRAGSVLAHCVSRMNLGDGYLAESLDPIDLIDPFANPELTDNASSFLHCSATRNQRDGFRTTVNSTFTHCTADRNGGGVAEDPMGGLTPGDGFDVVDSCRLVNCMASRNTLSGIRAIEDNYIEQNTCHTNGMFGIDLMSPANTVIKNYVKYNPLGGIAVGGAAVPAAGMVGVAPILAAGYGAAPNPFSNFAF